MACFLDANLRDATLDNAYLVGADFTHASLIDTDLTNADLTGADLRHANLAGADLTQADLDGAILTGLDLNTVRGLIDQQLAQAITDDSDPRLSETSTGSALVKVSDSAGPPMKPAPSRRRTALPHLE